MSKSNAIATKESIIEAIAKLKAEGLQVSIRAIKDKLGGGSLSTIHAKLKEVNADIPVISVDIEAKLRPFLLAGAELIQSTMREASTAYEASIDQCKLDIETLSEALSSTESEKDSALEELEALKIANLELTTSLKLANELRETIETDYERTKAELITIKIREADYLAAKEEAAEARNKAAKLEGRFEELERRNSTNVGGKLKKEPSVKSNKAA
jgi:hypothetical protein